MFLVGTPSLATFSNTSSAAAPSSSADSCVNEWGTHCAAIVFAEGFNFWPVVYTYVVATEYVTVYQNYTSTSVQYNTESFEIPAADFTSYKDYGTEPATVNNTSIVTFGTTLVGPQSLPFPLKTLANRV